jgi:uncharacterized protein DUF4375
MSEPKRKNGFFRMQEKIASHGFESLTPSERAAFALVWLYRETNDGGLDQFFFNDSGKLALNALRGLEMVGASVTADILRRAMSVFPDGIVPAELAARRQYLCDVLTPEQGEFLDQLTDEFFKNADTVEKLMLDYIKSHPEEFPT